MKRKYGNQSPFHMKRDSENITVPVLPKGAIGRLGQGRVNDLAVSPDLTYLAVGSHIGLWLYELSTLSPIALWDTEDGQVCTVTFSDDGQWLATGSYKGIVNIWDVHSGIRVTQMERRDQEKLDERKKLISQLSFSPNNQFLAASGTRDYIVDVWQTETGTPIAQFFGDSQIELLNCSLERPIAFTPDSRFLACVSPDGTQIETERKSDFISVWNVATGELVAFLEEQSGFCHSLCFSPCGRLLVSGGKDTVQIWDIASGELWQVYQGYGGYSMNVSYAPEGILRAVGESPAARTVAMWDVISDKRLYIYEADTSLYPVKFSNGTSLVFRSDMDLNIWRVGDARPLTFGHSHIQDPYSCAFTPDAQILVGGYWCDGILSWDLSVEGEQRPALLQTTGFSHSVFKCSRNKVFATSVDENVVSVWEIRDRKVIGTQDNRRLSVLLISEVTLAEKPSWEAVAFAPSLNLLAYGDSRGTLYLSDLRDGTKRHILRGHTSSVYFVAFSPDGKLLASEGEEGWDFRLWDVKHVEEINALPDRIGGIAFSPCSAWVALDTPEDILFWNVILGETHLTIQKPEDFRQILSAMVFSPCGRYLAAGSFHRLDMERAQIWLWSVSSGEHIETFFGHTGNIQSLAFSPDSTLLASGSFDGTLLLWDIRPYLQTE